MSRGTLPSHHEPRFCPSDHFGLEVRFGAGKGLCRLNGNGKKVDGNLGVGQRFCFVEPMRLGFGMGAAVLGAHLTPTFWVEGGPPH